MRQGNGEKEALRLLEVVFPLYEELVFLFGVAVLAARHQVALGAAAAADQGNDVVHGQFGGLELPPAIITDACGPFALPPLACAKLTGLCPLTGNLLR